MLALIMSESTSTPTHMDDNMGAAFSKDVADTDVASAVVVSITTVVVVVAAASMVGLELK